MLGATCGAWLGWITLFISMFNLFGNGCAQIVAGAANTYSINPALDKRCSPRCSPTACKHSPVGPVPSSSTRSLGVGGAAWRTHRGLCVTGASRPHGESAHTARIVTRWLAVCTLRSWTLVWGALSLLVSLLTHPRCMQTSLLPAKRELAMHL